MKKLLSILLVIVIVLSLSAVSAFGADNKYVYKDRFIEEYGYTPGSWDYVELYHHYADDNTVDWVLVRAHLYIMVEPTENPIYRDYVVGDIVYSTCYYFAPFETEYGIYDVAKDEFLDLTKIDFEQYSGLNKVVYEKIDGRPVGDLFKDKFVEQYELKEVYIYKEVCYHYDSNGAIDWCLVHGEQGGMATDDIEELLFDDFVLYRYRGVGPFRMLYGVYDVSKSEFVDLYRDYDDLYKYDGLMDALKTLPESKLIGDCDDDGELSILDATQIQLILAKLTNARIEDYYDSSIGIFRSFGDFDRDGYVSIMDATAIQRRLAKLDVPVATPDEV